MWDWLVKHHRHVIVLLILIVTFQLAYSDLFSRGPLVGPSKLVFETGAYIMSGIAGGLNSIKKAWNDYISLVNVKRENTELKEQVAMLKLKLTLLEDMDVEYKNILKILNLPLPHKNISYVTAMISARDMSSIFKSVIVNKGELDGIKVGDGVISTSGVVGRVVKLTPHAADILLLTDADSYIEGIDEYTRVRGIINGMGTDKLKFMYILSGGQVNAGDILLSGGKDGVFPEGVMVGTVTEVKSNPKGWLFKDITVKPSVDINRLNYVMILTGEKQ